MKKVLILSTLALACFSGTASAASGEIQFLGAVSSVTCDVDVVVGGSINKLIQLGTAPLNNEGAAVDFGLKAKGDYTVGSEGKPSTDCGALGTDDTVNITFAGNLDEQGLKNTAGSATGAYVKITAKNDKDSNTDPVVMGKNTRLFSGDKFNSATAVGAEFQATLVGGTIAGDFQSVTAFAVAYK